METWTWELPRLPFPAPAVRLGVGFEPSIIGWRATYAS
jgi:hypothetical protein